MEIAIEVATPCMIVSTTGCNIGKTLGVIQAAIPPTNPFQSNVNVAPNQPVAVVNPQLINSLIGLKTPNTTLGTFGTIIEEYMYEKKPAMLSRRSTNSSTAGVDNNSLGLVSKTSMKLLTSCILVTYKKPATAAMFSMKPSPPLEVISRNKVITSFQ
jgi:hypothetical protein